MDSTQLAHILKLRADHVPEVNQGDVFGVVALHDAKPKDLRKAVRLPLATLGPYTNMFGGKGFDEGTTEYRLHFSMPPEDSRCLRMLCNDVLRHCFDNPHINDFEEVVEEFMSQHPDDKEAAWVAFAKSTKPPWKDDGTWQIRVKSGKKSKRFMTSRTVEGVPCTSSIMAKPGGTVVADVRVYPWAFNGRHGMTLQLAATGVMIVNANNPQPPRKHFFPGHACVVDGKVRDATGDDFVIDLPLVIQNIVGNEVLIKLDQTIAYVIGELERKVAFREGVHINTNLRRDGNDWCLVTSCSSITKGDRHVYLVASIDKYRGTGTLTWTQVS